MASEKINAEGEIILPYSCKPRAPRSCLTPLGDKWKISAKLSIDPITGERIAEPGEKTDLNAYIQASKGSTDIVTIISKLQAGDESVINVRQGFYGDSTILPKDINDIVAIEKMNSQAKANYDKLPDDIKKLFSNDPSQFFSAVLDGSAGELINAYAVATEKAAAEAAAKAAEEKQKAEVAKQAAAEAGKE